MNLSRQAPAHFYGQHMSSSEYRCIRMQTVPAQMQVAVVDTRQ